VVDVAVDVVVDVVGPGPVKTLSGCNISIDGFSFFDALSVASETRAVAPFAVPEDSSVGGAKSGGVSAVLDVIFT